MNDNYLIYTLPMHTISGDQNKNKTILCPLSPQVL